LYVNTAVPAESAAGLPTWVPLLKNVTDPVGVPLPEAGLTVAERVTPLVDPCRTEEGVTMTAVEVEVLPEEGAVRLKAVPQPLGKLQFVFPP
jgi:hypothetical protein